MLGRPNLQAHSRPETYIRGGLDELPEWQRETNADIFEPIESEE